MPDKDAPGEKLLGSRSRPELKDSVAERPNHSNLCTSEFRQNSFRIQENFSELFRNSEDFRKSLQHAAETGHGKRNPVG